MERERNWTEYTNEKIGAVERSFKDDRERHLGMLFDVWVEGREEPITVRAASSLDAKRRVEAGGILPWAKPKVLSVGGATTWQTPAAETDRSTDPRWRERAELD
jgi:hypothetical protein